MPLFRRSDGELVSNLDPIRFMMPLVMPRRNDSVIYHTTRWDISRARTWLRAFNLRRGSGEPATLFHLVLYACVKMLHARPGLNRFVSGGRIYQRKGVWLSFAAKTRLAEDAPLTTIKLTFPQNVHLDDCVDHVTESVRDCRSGRPNPIEREVRFLTRLPNPLLRAVVAAGRRLDRFNLLPAALIDPDPMYTSMFLANLGSIHIENAFHHLYEHGTCSLFGVVGRAGRSLVLNRHRQAEVRETLQAQWSFDERVNDGFYCVESLDFLRRILEDPQHHVDCDAAHCTTSEDGSLLPASTPS